MGNVLTKLDVSRITLKSHGVSTLGGRKVWFDPDVKRLNYDEQGTFLGEFNSDEHILVILPNGEFYLTNIDLNNHYEDDILRIEKFEQGKVWTAVLFDQDQNGYPYIKRFAMEASARHQNFLGENPKNQLLLLTDTVYPRIQTTLGGADSFREPIILEAEEYIGVKSFKARGKRITTFAVDKVEELEPTRQPEPQTPEEDTERTASRTEEPDPYEGKSQADVADEMTGQMHLFDD